MEFLSDYYFLSGVNDNVRCFHCDGGLRCWSNSDDAWEEHAKWFPQCPYLVEVKGYGYIENVQRMVRENNGAANERRGNLVISPVISLRYHILFMHFFILYLIFIITL